MPESYDIFLSFNKAEENEVEYLYAQLAQVCGEDSIFFDKVATRPGEPLSTILQHAGTCKLFVAFLSEEYFTGSRWPMTELAAAKAGNGIPSLPCLFPVFFALSPDDAKDKSRQSRWRKQWREWEVNEKMGRKNQSSSSRVQPAVWEDALNLLLSTAGPTYIPEEYGDKTAKFLKNVAQVIARRLGEIRSLSSRDIVPSIVQDHPIRRFEIDHNTGRISKCVAKFHPSGRHKDIIHKLDDVSIRGIGPSTVQDHWIQKYKNRDAGPSKVQIQEMRLYKKITGCIHDQVSPFIAERVVSPRFGSFNAGLTIPETRSRSYDIFLSHSGAHSGAQSDFVKHLNAELARICGHYSVFFDRDSIEHGEQISTSILEYAGTCKLAVAVVSEEYFTRSRWPMMELAASYTAAKAGTGSPSLPCLLPVYLALRPGDAKNSSTQSGWRKMWQTWELNETMSERRKRRPRRVQPTVWKEAVDRLLNTRGPVYIPQKYGNDPEVFMKKVAQIIAQKLDDLNGGSGHSTKENSEKNRCHITW